MEMKEDAEGWNPGSALPDYGCERRTRSKGGKYCVSHALQMNRGEEFRPLQSWGVGHGLTCAGPGRNGEPCDRLVTQVNLPPGPLCKGHATQLERDGAMWQFPPKGDEWNDCAALDYGCGCKAVTKGSRFCGTHYNQYYRGDLTPIKRKAPNGTRCVGPGPDGTECGRKDMHQHDPIPLCKAHTAQYKDTGAMQVIVPRYKHASLRRDDDGNKRCTECLQWLPEDNFGKGDSGDGLSSRCLRCANDASRARKFGITRETYDALLSFQGGVCWICKQPPDFGRNSLSVDHDHDCCPDKYETCGSCIRGLVCGACNLALGLFDHKPERLEAGFKYLVEGVPHVLAYLRSRADVAGLHTNGDRRQGLADSV
jgi:hypothetical protein